MYREEMSVRQATTEARQERTSGLMNLLRPFLSLRVSSAFMSSASSLTVLMFSSMRLGVTLLGSTITPRWTCHEMSTLEVDTLCFLAMA